MYILYILIILGVVAIDQLTKWIVVNNIGLGESVNVINNVFRFTYIRNEGAAFGILSDKRIVFIVVSIVALVFLGFVLFKSAKTESKLFCVPLAMIIGGGIGNMIDRIALKYVIDFLDFCAFPNLWKYIFNVADSFVVVGVFVLIFKLVYDLIKEIKNGKNSPKSSD